MLTQWHWVRLFPELLFPCYHHSTVRFSLPHWARDSPEQTACCYTLAPKLGASSLTWQLAALEVKVASYLVQGVSLAIGPKVFLITFKVIDVI
jgi:hypothetical protein